MCNNNCSCGIPNTIDKQPEVFTVRYGNKYWSFEIYDWYDKPYHHCLTDKKNALAAQKYKKDFNRMETELVKFELTETE